MSENIEALAKLARDRVVDNRVYVDDRVYARELQRIFEKVWIFVAHESEVAETGDYVTATVAENPIIVCRDRGGQLRAYYNTCRHRGSLVVLDDAGHCNTFRCPYHFWTYGLDGALCGVPGEESYDGTGFDRDKFGLVELRCESVLGLVFVNIDDDAVPLEEWLGPEMIDVLRAPLANADFRIEGLQREEFAINWKVFAENARDGYHVPFVHPFFRRASPPGIYRLFRNGHAVQELGMAADKLEPEMLEKLSAFSLPGVEVGQGYIVNIFPDFTLTLRTNVVTIGTQHLAGPTGVVFETRTLGLPDDDEETKEIRRYSQRVWFDDPVELEDVPVFFGQQRGVASRGVRYSIIARGQDARSGTRGDDNRLREFWVQWRNMMGVEANTIDDLP
jgi:phenylpropionate dioxygenase-like ring-hydroxylating dioxygenase large terminal subunit